MAHASDNPVTVSSPQLMVARMARLQQWLQQQSLDGYLLPTQDEFMSEYPPASARRLEWLTGFSGSAGTGLFLARPHQGKSAILFTDGRYTLQAAQQLDADHFGVINSGEMMPVEWLAKHLPEATLGLSAWLHPHNQWRHMQARAKNVRLKAVDVIAVDRDWSDRPPHPSAPIHAHPIEYAGESASSKSARLIKQIQDNGAEAAFLALPDGINWLLNMRGSDIPFNPLVLCYALVKANGEITLITEPRATGYAALGDAIRILDVNRFYADPITAFEGIASIMIDPATTAHAIVDAAQKSGCRIIEAADMTLLPKAVKNPVEIEGMRRAHQRDGRAVSAFLSWLQSTLASHSVTEIEASNQLESFRREYGGALYRGPSFDTISGSGPNGAIVHYRASESSNRLLGQGELYLVDSGAQYPDGTTDITRTVACGTPTAEMKDRFTRVLKGHIAIATAIFPKGTTGSQLDALARHALWQVGCDYDHGTGHGVGSYLCVHEGPQRISKRGGDAMLAAGMILSNEPGYYKTGEYGIRIENLVLVIEHSTDGFLAFETLTLAPIDLNLVDNALLTDTERAWLEAYHQRVEANLVG